MSASTTRPRPRPVAQSGGKIAGAAGHIQRPLPGPQAGQRQRESLPQPVRARRHQVVHQVVIAGDGVEHAAHAARLSRARNPLEAEIGGLGGRSSHLRIGRAGGAGHVSSCIFGHSCAESAPVRGSCERKRAGRVSKPARLVYLPRLPYRAQIAGPFRLPGRGRARTGISRCRGRCRGRRRIPASRRTGLPARSHGSRPLPCPAPESPGRGRAL